MNNLHPFSNTIFCKNNFFNNPQKIVNLSLKQEYTISKDYPGKRTGNLLESADLETKQFGLFFAKKIASEVYPGIHKFMLDIRFHINDVYDIDIVNTGWIHSDECNIAGLVYLNNDEINFDTGTSIFIKKNPVEFSSVEIPSRQDFNSSGIITDDYIRDLTDNHKNFLETIKFGNVYNRLISYDAKLFHRPNHYMLSSGNLRTTLLFFINEYVYDAPCRVDLNSFWID